MDTLLALVGCVVFGLAGRFLYRNPVKVLNAVYKQYEFQYGRFTLGFFRIFGATMMAMAALAAVVTLPEALLSAFR